MDDRAAYFHTPVAQRQVSSHDVAVKLASSWTRQRHHERRGTADQVSQLVNCCAEPGDG
jgi:hypothetical protein